MDQFDPKQQKNNPNFDVIQPSAIVEAHSATREDVSFSSFLKPHINNNNKKKNNAEESDQISIFDAAKYFSGVHDNLIQQKREKELDVVSAIPPRLSSVSSSVETTSSYGARNSQSSDRTRSFSATPTASSEASWNSQAGLLVNPPGSVGINMIKSLTNNNTWSRGTTNNSHVSSKWPRISTKWLSRGRKCPCYGKKAVQVVEKMVHPRKTRTSSNATHFLYSPTQTSSPKSLSTKLSTHAHDSKSSNDVDLMVSNNNGNNDESKGAEFSSLTLYDELAAAAAAATTSTIAIARTTSNGFTFPILETQPNGFKKMLEDSHRDSLEAFQPIKCLQTSKSRRTSYEDENVSDGSSDLFEIESFSTFTYPCRDSIDDDHVIVPGLNITKLGIICSCYSNQGRKDNNNNSNVADENDYVTTTTTTDRFNCVTLTNLPTSASDMAYNAIRHVAEDKDGEGDGHGDDGTRNESKEEEFSVGLSPVKSSGQEGPLVAAMHVSGRPHAVGAAYVNGNAKSKTGLVVET